MNTVFKNASVGFLSKLAFACLLLVFACPVKAAVFANGADVGWLTQMEASGVRFFNSSGTQQDCLQILKGVGMNSIRLRVWVNPAGGWNGQADVVNKAVRAKNLGFRIMIDFHYSDSWADPGKQTKPAAWSSHGISQLFTDVYNHTSAVLNALKTAGVTPEWVQVGNETNNGMLWNDGRASTSMGNFAGLVTSGYNAVKSVFPGAKVIVHISNGYDNGLFRWIFDGLQANGAGSKYDVIGMSLYPSTSNWATLNNQCLANMNDMVARYGKEVMMAEVGMDVSAAATAKSFLTDIINKTKSVSGGKGLGVFYWEPQSHNNWQGYTKGAFGTNGRPTIALDAFGGGGGGGGGGGPVSAGTYSLQNLANGKMLDNLGATADGATVAQWADGSSNNQRWVLSYVGTSARLTCVTGGKSLDSLAHTADRSTVGQWATNTSNNQLWTLQAQANGYYKIINVANGKCLDTGGAANDGGVMTFFTSGTSSNQQWRFVTP